VIPYCQGISTLRLKHGQDRGPEILEQLIKWRNSEDIAVLILIEKKETAEASAGIDGAWVTMLHLTLKDGFRSTIDVGSLATFSFMRK
jgi:hypothetical protein